MDPKPAEQWTQVKGPAALTSERPGGGSQIGSDPPPHVLMGMPREDAASSSSFVSRDPGLMKGITDDTLGRGVVFTNADRQIIVSDVKWKAGRYEQLYPGRHISFAVCRAGGGFYRRDADKQKLSGQFLPGTVNIGLVCGKGVLESPYLHLASIGVTPERLDGLWNDMVPTAPLSSIDGSRFYRNPLLEQLIVAAVDQAENGDLSALFFDHVLSLIVHQIARTKPASSERNQGLSRRQLKLAVEFMEGRLAHDIRLQELANLVGLSVAEFSRRFRVSAGKPPYSYFMRLRMNEAISLMPDLALSVSEIGARVGYPNPSQFAKEFQKFSGLSPMKWRRQHLGQKIGVGFSL